MGQINEMYYDPSSFYREDDDDDSVIRRRIYEVEPARTHIHIATRGIVVIAAAIVVIVAMILGYNVHIHATETEIEAEAEKISEESDSADGVDIDANNTGGDGNQDGGVAAGDESEEKKDNSEVTTEDSSSEENEDYSETKAEDEGIMSFDADMLGQPGYRAFPESTSKLLKPEKVDAVIKASGDNACYVIQREIDLIYLENGFHTDDPELRKCYDEFGFEDLGYSMRETQSRFSDIENGNVRFLAEKRDELKKGQ